jgi:hypothetical protein
VALPPFTDRSTSPADQAWRTGVSPYSGTLGPNRTADTIKNTFVAKTKDNPDFNDFYKRTFSEIAPDSQAKIDAAAATDVPNFSNPGDQSFAIQFAKDYAAGVSKGLIEEDRAVTKDGLARLSTEFATQGSTQKDPNTANKFPSQGVSVA